jgi:hypothetical protein
MLLDQYTLFAFFAKTVNGFLAFTPNLSEVNPILSIVELGTE